MREDTGVSVIGDSLEGKRVILAVSGGIAATESVKLARELRRHGAEVFPMMTKSAEKVITPLALSWGSGIDVVTDWKSEMSQLGGFDGLILA
ncbi:MAG: flavoprotein, partial [Candidatus Thermoplasmatota archaeon]|nr:flavoprotein [Candidatus Thermoplasmatota archaeon]